MKRAFLAILAVLLLASNTWARGLVDNACMDTGGDSSCVDGNDAQTVLLIHSNTTDGSTTFVDSSVGGGHTANITVNGDTHHETDYIFSGFGTSSIYFDGTGDYLSIADSADWDLAAGDFCVELIWNFGAVVNDPTGFIGRYENINDNWGLQWSTNKLYWYHSAAAYEFAWVPAINTPYHIAVTRVGGTLRTFVNGIQVGVDQADATNYNTAGALSVGAYRTDGAAPAIGYMTEVAIHKGDGVYPIGGFTPNSLPYCD